MMGILFLFFWGGEGGIGIVFDFGIEGYCVDCCWVVVGFQVALRLSSVKFPIWCEKSPWLKVGTFKLPELETTYS